MAVMRLDKMLGFMGIGSRSDIKKYAKWGDISVNGKKTLKCDIKIDTDKDIVTYKGKEVIYREFYYYMLNKPAGVLSATEDKSQKTVLDLIDSTCKDLFPVGRLDKDTVGLLVITNDGQMAHDLLSPKKHVDKVYEAVLDGPINDDIIEEFSKGIKVDEDFIALPAILKSVSDDNTRIQITIREGKFHQIKRMFEAVNLTVTWLKRLSMGNLELDESLKEGEYRELSENEIKMLKGPVNE